MNDYWNDPPEYDEPPECCEDIMQQLEDGTCVCEHCSKRIEPAQDIEPVDIEPWPPLEEMPEMPAQCPHGREWGSCDACDHASDIAYDAARERRN